MLIDLLEANTHLQHAEYRQCFLMAWFVVERFVEVKWEEFLGERGIIDERKRRQVNTPSWSTHMILEALYLGGKLPEELYSDVKRAKETRNKLIHKSAQVTKEQALEVMKLARTLVDIKTSQST